VIVHCHTDVEVCLLYLVSNEVPEHPVVSPVSGCIYERRLIEKYITENGTDPMNGEKLNAAELVDIKSKLLLLHPFNGPFSGTTRVSRYQKGETNLDFTEARDSEWQWHQLGHMEVCTSLQTDNHASTHHSVFYRPDALPAAQPTASKH